MYILCLKMAYMSLYEKQKLKYKNQNRKLTTEKKSWLYITIYMYENIFTSFILLLIPHIYSNIIPIKNSNTVPI